RAEGRSKYVSMEGAEGTGSFGGAPNTFFSPRAPARFCLDGVNTRRPVLHARHSKKSTHAVSHQHRQQAKSWPKQIELPGRKIADVESCVGGLCRTAVAGGGARSIGLEEGMGKNRRSGQEGRPG